MKMISTKAKNINDSRSKFFKESLHKTFAAVSLKINEEIK